MSIENKEIMDLSLSQEMNSETHSFQKTETFNYIKFNDVPISTQTIISVSNLKFNLNTMYQYLPITDYVIVKKKRGRKKKVEVANPNENIPPGSIISIQNKTQLQYQ